MGSRLVYGRLVLLMELMVFCLERFVVEIGRARARARVRGLSNDNSRLAQVGQLGLRVRQRPLARSP